MNWKINSVVIFSTKPGVWSVKWYFYATSTEIGLNKIDDTREKLLLPNLMLNCKEFKKVLGTITMIMVDNMDCWIRIITAQHEIMIPQITREKLLLDLVQNAADSFPKI